MGNPIPQANRATHGLHQPCKPESAAPTSRISGLRSAPVGSILGPARPSPLWAVAGDHVPGGTSSRAAGDASRHLGCSCVVWETGGHGGPAATTAARSAARAASTRPTVHKPGTRARLL